MTRNKFTLRRNSEQTRAKILEAFVGEIYRKGFRNSNINEVLHKLKLTKGAFFHHFPTKEDLGYSIVDEILKPLIYERWVHPVDEYENPIDGILLNFKRLIMKTPKRDLSLGCPLNNLVQEVSALDFVFKRKLADVLELWIEGTEKHLRRAQSRGYLKEKTDIRKLAEFIVMTVEGTYGMGKATGDRKLYLRLQSSLSEYLELFRVDQ